MDDKTAELVNHWMAYLIPAFLTIAGAIAAGIGVLVRKLWTGVSYYAEKLWTLADKAVNKHLEFTDSIATSMNVQTGLLTEIKTETSRAIEVIDQLGSDPTGAIKIKSLVDQLKDSPTLCKYSKEEIEKYLKVIIDHKRQQTKRGQADGND